MSSSSISTGRTRVLAGASWLVLGNGTARALTVATALAAARALGQADFGGLMLVQLTIATAANLLSLQLGQTATRFVAHYRHSSAMMTSRVIRLVKGTAGVSGLAASTILFFASDWVGRSLLGQISVVPLIRLGAPAVFLILYSGAQTGILCGFEKFREVAACNAAGNLCMFSGVLLGSLQYGIYGAVMGWVLGNAALCLCGSYALAKMATAFDITYPRHGVSVRAIVFGYSLPLFIASACLSIVLFRCNAMLSRHYSLSEVGLYSAADRVHLLLLFVPGTLLWSSLPVLANLHSEGDREGYKQVLHTLLWTTVLILVAPAILVASLSGTILSLAFGESFRPAAAVLAVLCATAVFEISNTFLGQLFVITGRIWLRASIDIGMGAVLLVCAVFWVPRFGSIGLAGAYAVSFAAATAGLALARPGFGAAPERSLSAHA